MLLSDALTGMLNEFYTIAIARLEHHPNPKELTQRLDALQTAITTVTITGDVSEETTDRQGVILTAEDKVKASSLATGFGISLEEATRRVTEERRQKLTKRAGREAIHLAFGSIAGALADLVTILGGKRTWFLIDEWSEIPVDIQPYLADLFRRVVLPVNAITVKIAAIEHRTNFAILKDRGEYVGLELGADLAADLNLDDFLVFDNSQEKAVDFTANLIFRHYQSSPSVPPVFSDANAFISGLFTQRPVFEEFVRAVEGVPHDALNLLAKVVTKAFGQQIAMSHVRAGARDWYNQDKAAVICNDTPLADLLQHIVDEVIGNRRTRAFLLSLKTRFSGVDKLFDSRLLHLLKKNVSSNEEPGAR